MTLTRDEAARALAEMETAQRRTSVLARYSAGGPILMLWGAEWFVCNLVSQFGGPAANWVWPVATLFTIVLTFWISSRRPDPTNRKGWKAFATSAAVGGFFAGLFAILRLHDMQQGERADLSRRGVGLCGAGDLDRRPLRLAWDWRCSPPC